MTDKHAVLDVAAEQADVAGLDTSYRRRGTGANLLFLGGLGYSDKWLPIHEELSASFDVIASDHPGSGLTEIPDFVNDFNDLAVHYATFLDGLGIDAVHLVGHSHGAWIAAEFAAIYPTRVLSLTLVSPWGTVPDEEEPMFDFYRLDRGAWFDAVLGADHESFLPILNSDEDVANRELIDYKDRIGIARVAWSPRYSYRLEHRLPRVTAPSQVLVPQEDKVTLPSVARRFTELLNISAPVTIVGESSPTQHHVVLQEPAQIAQKVVELSARAS